MSKEKANSILEVKGTLNTENTGREILCPYCGKRNTQYDDYSDAYAGDRKCVKCDNEFVVRYNMDYSTIQNRG